MDRLQAFEAMLSELAKQAEAEQAQMNELKAAGKEKTATYRQLLGKKMTYAQIFDGYRQYGLTQ